MPEHLDAIIKTIIKESDSRGLLVFGPRKLGNTLLLMTIAYYVSAIRKAEHAGDPAYAGPIGFWLCVETDDLPRLSMPHNPIICDEVTTFSIWPLSKTKALLNIVGIGQTFWGRFASVPLQQSQWRAASSNDEVADSFPPRKFKKGHVDAIREKGTILDLWHEELTAGIPTSTKYKGADGKFVKSMLTAEGHDLYIQWSKKARHDLEEAAAPGAAWAAQIAQAPAQAPALAPAEAVAMHSPDALHKARGAAAHYKRKLRDLLGETPSPPQVEREVRCRDLKEMFAKASTPAAPAPTAPAPAAPAAPARQRLVPLRDRFQMPSSGV